MGYFGDQIEERKRHDSEVFDEAFLKIAGAVTGEDYFFSQGSISAKSRSAIESILRFYKIKNTDIPDSITDVNDQLEYLLRPHGIMRRAVTLSKGWYKDAYGAMLGQRRDNGDFIAIIPKRFGGYYFYDMGKGKKVRVTSKNENIASESALAFYVPFPLSKMNVAAFGAYMVKTLSLYDLFMIGATSLIAVLIGMNMPYLNKMLFSDVELSGSETVLAAMAIFMIFTMLSKTIINTVKTMYVTSMTTKTQISVEAAAMMRVLSLPGKFFKKYSSGELSSRLGGVKSLCDIIINSLFSTGLTGLFSLLYIGQIFTFAPQLASTAVAVVAVTVFVSLISSLWQIKVSRKQMELAAKENGIGFAFISGIQKIKLAGAEKRAFAKWADVYSPLAKALYDYPLFLKLNSVIVTAIGLIGVIFIYYAAVKNKMTVSDYYAFNSAYAMLQGAFSSLAGVFITFAQAKPVLDMCEPIFESVPEVSEGKQVIERLSGDIELNSVTFGYSEDMPNVLENFSLKIRRGEYLAIVGATGCGKSTLLRVLLGFETPQRGAVYYGEKDITKIDLKSLRRKIGVVMQDGKLFQGDIFSNIVVSSPNSTLEDAWRAAEIAGIAEDIRNMPMGMFTVISEGSGGISGGQKQRIMIARAVIAKPKILILDEATSALDNITQRKVSEALSELKCTRIVIAHRLSTIKECDRIIVMEGGRIAEEGSYEKLIAKNGIFADLVSKQRL